MMYLSVLIVDKENYNDNLLGLYMCVQIMYVNCNNSLGLTY